MKNNILTFNSIMKDGRYYKDILDIRDIIELFEELEPIYSNNAKENYLEIGEDEAKEFRILSSLLEDLKGYGGDEQWRGDWYPVNLILDSYFEDYAQELAEDIGAINRNATWPNNCIDWTQAARELQQDYSTVALDGVTYFYR